MPIFTGLDRLLRASDQLAGRRYGLLAHGASVTEDLRPAHVALAASKAGPPAVLLGPEHGYYGVEQDMVASRDETDPMTGATIVSLYGDDADSLVPRAEAFAGLEVLLIDLQDVGSRYYTYAATAVWAAEVAIKAGVEVWVLDRPNPLGGSAVEGSGRDERYTSFVGAFDMPVRHGLTLGEIVRLEGKRRAWPEEALRVFTLAGWRRTQLWPELGRPWIAPSPNMPSFDTAVVYPGGCLLEATSLSEGRGTTRPFLLIGAPGVDAKTISDALNARRPPGLTFLPTYFKPQFQKHAGEVCGGVEIVVTDARAVRPYRWGIECLGLFRQLFPEAFAWREQPYEFVTDRPAIDLLTGGDGFRLALESAAGDDAVNAWLRTWPTAEKSFRQERQSILLYP